MLRWMTLFEQLPLVILPTLCDLPPKQRSDVTVEGKGNPAIDAPGPAGALLGLPGLAVPVGSHASRALACRS